jgi:hypothetical protein
MFHRPTRALALAAAVALVAAACGGDDSDTTSTATTAADSTAGTGTTAMEMELPPYAADMKIDVSSPSAGATLTANEIEVNVTASGFDLACDQAGKPLAEGAGHYHVLLDKSLVDMYCTETATISMQNVEPGPHTLEIVPAINDHAEVLENAKEIDFDYQPTSPLALVEDVADPGTPSIKIVSPKAGDVVSGDFDVVVEISNFTASCDLYGKPGVAGYGHWHVNLDSTSGPMMGMGTMLGMSCENVFHASTAGLSTGETHSVIALLVDNGHAPFVDMVSDEVEVTIG